MFSIHRSGFIPALSALAIAGGAVAFSAIQASADSLPAFTCSDTSGGSDHAATVTSIRTAHHPGFDRLVVGFATSNSLPPYSLSRQATSSFTRDASGQPVTLQGAAGVRLVLRNSDLVDGLPADFKPALPEIREVTNIGNFERVVSYGVGLADQACLRVFALTSPTRLVIDVQTPADSASAATSAGSQPVASSSSASDSTTTQVADTLASTGHPAQVTQPVLPLIAGVLGVLALITGLAVVSRRRLRGR